MNIAEIIKSKKYVEGGRFQNGSLEMMSNRYSQQHDNAISPFDIIINSTRSNEIIRDGKSYKCIADYGKLPSSSKVKGSQAGNTREVWTRMSDGFKTGDIVLFTHDPELSPITYILISTTSTREKYDLSVMQPAIATLKWLDVSGLIRETPFILKTAPSSTALQEDKIMILSKERRVILIQSNDDTRQIKKDKRFIFDGRCWKVVGYNGLTEGLLELTLEEDLINESNDNLELRIADYFGNTAVYTVRILNGEIATISTFDTLQLVVEVRNKDNTLVNGARVEFDSSNQEVITVSEDGLITPRSEGTAVVTASYKGGSMQMQINVVPMATNNYSVEISGNSEIKFTRSSTYTVTFYNNGLSFTDKALFKLLADDGVSETSLASITSYTDSSCILKANSTMGYVRLKVINQNGLIANEMRIKVKSLI